MHVGRHRHDADGSVGLENGQLDLGKVADLSVLADSGDDFVLGDALAVEVRGDKLAVLDEDDGDAFDELAHSHAAKPEAGNHSIDGQQRRGRDETSLEAGVGSDHGVLDGVGDEEDHDQVERGELAELAASTEAEPSEHGGVDDEGSSDDLDQVHEVGVFGAQIVWWSSVVSRWIALTISSASTLVS